MAALDAERWLEKGFDIMPPTDITHVLSQGAVNSLI
jgi:hypothetical protein